MSYMKLFLLFTLSFGLHLQAQGDKQYQEWPDDGFYPELTNFLYTCHQALVERAVAAGRSADSVPELTCIYPLVDCKALTSYAISLRWYYLDHRERPYDDFFGVEVPNWEWSNSQNMWNQAGVAYPNSSQFAGSKRLPRFRESDFIEMFPDLGTNVVTAIVQTNVTVRGYEVQRYHERFVKVTQTNYITNAVFYVLEHPLTSWDSFTNHAAIEALPDLIDYFQDFADPNIDSPFGGADNYCARENVSKLTYAIDQTGEFYYSNPEVGVFDYWMSSYWDDHCDDIPPELLQYQSFSNPYTGAKLVIPAFDELSPCITTQAFENPPQILEVESWLNSEHLEGAYKAFETNSEVCQLLEIVTWDYDRKATSWDFDLQLSNPGPVPCDVELYMFRELLSNGVITNDTNTARASWDTEGGTCGWIDPWEDSWLRHLDESNWTETVDIFVNPEQFSFPFNRYSQIESRQNVGASLVVPAKTDMPAEEIWDNMGIVVSQSVGSTNNCPDNCICGGPAYCILHHKEYTLTNVFNGVGIGDAISIWTPHFTHSLETAKDFDARSPSPYLDTNMDGVLRKPAQFHSLSTGTGTAGFQISQKDPFLYLPLTSWAPWRNNYPDFYFTFPPDLYLPYRYLPEGEIDIDGAQSALSSFTRILERYEPHVTEEMIGEQSVPHKFVSVIRPGGQYVVFKFEFDYETEAYESLGLPMPPHDHMNYVLDENFEEGGNYTNSWIRFESGAAQWIATDWLNQSPLATPVPFAGTISDTCTFEPASNMVIVGTGWPIVHFPAPSFRKHYTPRYICLETDDDGFCIRRQFIHHGDKYSAEFELNQNVFESVTYTLADGSIIDVTLNRDASDQVYNFEKSLIPEASVARINNEIHWDQGTVISKSSKAPSFSITTQIPDLGNTTEQFTYSEHNILTEYIRTVGTDEANVTVTLDDIDPEERHPNGFRIVNQPTAIEWMPQNKQILITKREGPNGWPTETKTFAPGPGNSVVTTYQYDGAAGVPQVGLQPNAPFGIPLVTETRTSDGKLLSRILTPNFADHCEDENFFRMIAQRAGTAGANWDDASNLSITNYIHASGESWSLSTEGEQKIDGKGGTTMLSINGQLLSTSVINNFGHVTSFTPHESQAAGYTVTDFDTFGRPERLAWENGMETLFNNYTFNGPLEIVGVDGSPSSISYNQVGLVDTVSGTLGTVDFEYNPLGIQTKATSTAGGQSHVMQQNVDALARLKDVTGPLGTTTFTPGDNGTASISFPDQATLSHSISGFGQSATTGNALPAPTFRSVEPNGNGFEISSGLGSAATSERKIETQFDLLGRITSSSAPGQGVTSFEKNPDGTIKRVSHSSGYATRLEYNEHKEPTQSGLDLDNNGELDLLGSDRLTSVDIQRGSFSLSSPISEDGSKAISIAGTIDPMGLSGSLQQNNRSSTWSTGPITSGGDFDRTTTDSSGISTTSEYDNWRLTKRTTHGFDGSQILVEDFDYKPLGQLELYTAIPGGQIEYRYDSKFRMYETVSRLLDANGAIVAGSERIATTHFESDHTTRPDTINQTAKPTLDLEINKANQVMSATGGELIPREYQYDHGALSEIHTQRDGDPQQTVFHYHDNGQFDRKEINGAMQHQVVYDGNGIARHIDGPRGRTSLHLNDATGDLLGLSYHPTDSSITAPVDYHDFDRQGVPHRITYDGTERILDTTVYGEIHHESVSYPGGEASAVDRVFDEASGWLDASTCTTPGATDTTVYTPRGDYSIDSIDYGDAELTYHYHPHFRSVSGFDLDDQGQVVLRRRELLTPLGQIEHIVYSNAAEEEIGRISYTYYPGSRRIASKTLLDGRRWEYQYAADSGALQSAELFAPGGTTPIDARYYEYDSLGNRTELGDLVQAKSYQLNADNQVTGSLHLAETSVQGWLDPASGLNWSNVEIRVDGQSVQWTNGVFTYLVPAVATNASATSRILRITALVESNGTQACVAVIERTIAQPKGLGIARYSSAGELESDGLYKYEWNMRGELRQATSLEAGWRKRLRFHYLDNGKLWKYEVEQEDGAGIWQAIRTHRYDYDGWNVVEERVTDAAGQVTRKRHLWGLDLAGQVGGQQAAMQRAGGVGGLLGTVVTVGNGLAEFQPVLLDHLGSVEGRLVDGQLVKHFYGPYGTPEAGPGAEAGYGYSTKPYIPELGLYYYGYRFYSPRTGRWISRDPIQEDGGLNLYGFVGNDPVNSIDYLGMAPASVEDIKQAFRDKYGGTVFLGRLEEALKKKVSIETVNLGKKGFSVSSGGIKINNTLSAEEAASQLLLAFLDYGKLNSSRAYDMARFGWELKGSAAMTSDEIALVYHERKTVPKRIEQIRRTGTIAGKSYELMIAGGGEALCPPAALFGAAEEFVKTGDPRSTVLTAGGTYLVACRFADEIAGYSDEVDDARRVIVEVSSNPKGRGAFGRTPISASRGVKLPDDVLQLAEQNLTDSGLTVLGSFRATPGKLNYIQKARQRGASYFDVGKAWDDLVSRGLNWDANRHFLDVISSRGDDVLLSIPKSEIVPGKYLAREVQYLVSEKGYRWINQWKLVAP